MSGSGILGRSLGAYLAISSPAALAQNTQAPDPQSQQPAQPPAIEMVITPDMHDYLCSYKVQNPKDPSMVFSQGVFFGYDPMGIRRGQTVPGITFREGVISILKNADNQEIGRVTIPEPGAAPEVKGTITDAQKAFLAATEMQSRVHCEQEADQGDASMLFRDKFTPQKDLPDGVADPFRDHRNKIKDYKLQNQ